MPNDPDDNARRRVPSRYRLYRQQVDPAAEPDHGADPEAAVDPDRREALVAPPPYQAPRSRTLVRPERTGQDGGRPPPYEALSATTPAQGGRQPPALRRPGGQAVSPAAAAAQAAIARTGREPPGYYDKTVSRSGGAGASAAALAAARAALKANRHDVATQDAPEHDARRQLESRSRDRARQR